MYKKNSPANGMAQVGRILAVASGKGGVGKSTVTVNLAAALSAAGQTVGILDADLYGPSLRQMLPEDEGPRQKKEQLEPALARGIRVMTLAYFRNADRSSAIRAPIANGIISQFIENVDWGELDYLLVDFPPGTGDIQMTLCQKVRFDGAILVTTPQKVALLDVQKSLDMFRQVKVQVVGIVQNMSYLDTVSGRTYPFGTRKEVEGWRERNNLPLLGEIRLDEQLCQWCEEGRAAVFADKSHPVSKAFIEIAEKLGAPEEKEVCPVVELLNSHEVVGYFDKGQKVVWKAEGLQEKCPCALCMKQRAEGSYKHLSDVVIHKVEVVGKYGVRFRFSKGCLNGIYGYEFLRDLAKS